MRYIQSILSYVAAIGFCAAPYGAFAQSFSLNADALSSLEEPLAVAVGRVTISVTGLIDGSTRFELEPNFEDDINPAFTGNIQATVQTQLNNRWNAGVMYFGQYATDPVNILNFGSGPGAPPEDFTDNVGVFIRGAWGGVVGGNVTMLVREETRRLRGFGNGRLAFDSSFGRLDNWGGGYVGQFGPARLSALVDDDGNFDIGASWSRPLGTRDYRFTARYTNGAYLSDDGTTWFSSRAGSVVTEAIWGSWTFDATLGFEDLNSVRTEVERIYGSGGVRFKIGAISLSLEGHYGDVSGDSETSAAFGASYDLARGLSLNLGANHSDANVEQDGVIILQREATEIITSVRYSF